MSETYALGGQEEAATGKIILMVVSSLSALLVIAGLIYATGTGQRHKEALAAAECEPNRSPSGLQCTTVQMLVSQYTAIMTPASKQLSIDATAYTANEGHNLPAAEAALTAEVTSEHALDASLARFPFPPAVAPAATALIHASQARAKLTAEQAQSSSLTQLRSFNHRVQVASAAAATEMRLVRKALNTPPTVAQES
jgi:hypothetical protein